MNPIGVLAAAIVVVAVALLLALAHRQELPALASPVAVHVPPETVSRGAGLAALGNCSACHTLSHGAYFAGGNGLRTGFGTLYSTNITPAPRTGLGLWSEAAFNRAMREGVDRKGHHLYPAFPYEHFALLTDEDLHALYAYVMTREPVEQAAHPNELEFPFNLRPLIFLWKWMYVRTPPAAADRGQYLVDAIAHCGACHTERNALGAESPSRYLAGGEVEGWNAYAINQGSRSPVSWTADAITYYLQHGWEHEHGVSRGPMTAVTDSLASADNSDVRAIAEYVARLMRSASNFEGDQPRRAVRKLHNDDPVAAEGAPLFAAACAGCHDGSRELPYGGITFDRSTAVSAPNPLNMINVILYGLPAADGKASPVMPPFNGAITDSQLSALLRYMRARFSDEPAWRNIESQMSQSRRGP